MEPDGDAIRYAIKNATEDNANLKYDHSQRSTNYLYGYACSSFRQMTGRQPTDVEARLLRSAMGLFTLAPVED